MWALESDSSSTSSDSAEEIAQMFLDFFPNIFYHSCILSPHFVWWSDCPISCSWGMRVLVNRRRLKKISVTLSRKLFQPVGNRHDRLIGWLLLSYCRYCNAAGCREPFSEEGTIFVSLGVPQNGTHFTSACTKARQTRITQYFLSSQFQ